MVSQTINPYARKLKIFALKMDIQYLLINHLYCIGKNVLRDHHLAEDVVDDVITNLIEGNIDKYDTSRPF